MTGDATFTDYLWTTSGSRVFGSYCLTLIENADVEDVIAALPVIGRFPGHTFDDLEDLYVRTDWDPDRLLVGLAKVGDWVLMYEINGYVGITTHVMEPVSREILSRPVDRSVSGGLVAG